MMDNSLSVFDQWMPDIYIRQIICFQTTSQPDIADIIVGGLRKTMDAMPFLAQSIRCSGMPTSKSSLQLGGPIRPLEELISYQDFSDVLHYDDLRRAHFPLHQFPDGTFTPPDSKSIAEVGEVPVLLVKFNHLKEGILICACIHHMAVDITGFGEILKVWASKTRDEGYILTADCLTRGRIGPQSHTHDAGLRRDVSTDFWVLPPSVLSKDIEKQPPRQTVLLHFTAESLQALKAKISERLSCTNDIWISTSDALTALLWCSITEAHKDVESHGDTIAAIGLSVNVRRRMTPPLPDAYIGNAVAIAWPSVSVTKLLEGAKDIEAMAEVARQIRSRLQDIDVSHVQGTYQFLETNRDVPGLIWGPKSPRTTWIASWAGQEVYNLEWGPERSHCCAVRYPPLRLKWCLILPRRPDGSLEVLLAVKREYIAKLKRVELLNRYASWRCG